MLVVNPKAIPAVVGLGHAALAKTALAIEAQTKANIREQGLIDTGNLLNSVQASPTGPTSWTVRVAADYAAYLEMGTRYISPRPYFRPAIETVSAMLGQGNVPE